MFVSHSFVWIMKLVVKYSWIFTIMSSQMWRLESLNCCFISCGRVFTRKKFFLPLPVEDFYGRILFTKSRQWLMNKFVLQVEAFNKRFCKERFRKLLSRGLSQCYSIESAVKHIFGVFLSYDFHFILKYNSLILRLHFRYYLKLK